LFSNQAKALLLASYSTGKVTIENKVVAAKNDNPINNNCGKYLTVEFRQAKSTAYN
jgi:hypothetical protein